MQKIAIDSSQWTDMLVAGASQSHVALSSEQARQFNRYARLLLEWNRKINLTTITDPVQIAVKHFIDSVAPLDHLSKEGEWLDLGTGGGFPGIPLKIMRPWQPMTLIDGTRKKINFVKQVIRELELEKIEALHQRAEAMGEMAPYVHRYATIVSRAVADITQVALLAEPLLANNGKIVVYKGPGESVPKALELTPKHRTDRAVAQFKVTSGTYKLPIFGDPRRVIILERYPHE